MILKDWLRKEGLLPYQFARQAGFAPATIYKSISGDQRLSARLAVKVEALTSGQVSRTEAIWPEDYQEEVEGGTQMRTVPKSSEEKKFIVDENGKVTLK